MSRSYWNGFVEQLRGSQYQLGLIKADTPVHAVDFQRGMTELELTSVEDRFGFRFPPDLRDLLQVAVPHGPGFPDWRSGSDTSLWDCINWPIEGILFDVHHNGFWHDDWGLRPSTTPDALEVARAKIANAPHLIPVFGHRMIPDEPHEPGNPVFSIYQTDIIRYGNDLCDYLQHEFGLECVPKREFSVRRIRFWDSLIE